eukprot:84742-Hanusia_phi.AAC.2
MLGRVVREVDLMPGARPEGSEETQSDEECEAGPGRMASRLRHLWSHHRPVRQACQVLVIAHGIENSPNQRADEGTGKGKDLAGAYHSHLRTVL